MSWGKSEIKAKRFRCIAVCAFYKSAPFDSHPLIGCTRFLAII